jgi:hypothetical protein
VATGVIYIGSGVQSYSTNDIGNNSYALDGESLSLADAGAVYTIDELDADDAEIIDDNEGRTEDSFANDSSSESDADATETGASVNFGGGLVNDPYSIDTDDDGTVADSATGLQDPPVDTLQSIVRGMLGDSHRSSEILDLNRDLIDDPAHLIVG